MDPTPPMPSNPGYAHLQTEQQHQRTVIRHQYSQAPLQWLGPLDPRSPCPVVYLRNPNGGLLQGDHHSISLNLGSQTQLEIRSQGATRLHPGHSRQTIQISLADQSCLIWIGHPLIPGAGTQFHQQIQIQMAPTARLAYAEIWTAGRIGMGEWWQFEHILSQIQVWMDPPSTSTPWLWECLDLRYPQECLASLQSAGVLGSYSCWGSLYLLGSWDPIDWPLTPTQWQIPSPNSDRPGQILRQLGDQAHAIWNTFQAVIPC